MSGRHAEIAVFLTVHGWDEARHEPMGADWSNRRYQRLRRGEATAILMDASGDAPVGPFIAVDRWLRGLGLHAPEILAADEPAGLLLLEDLGDGLLSRVVAEGADEFLLYELAIDVLLHCQAAGPAAFLPQLDDAALLDLLDLHVRPEAQGRAEFRTIWAGLLPLVRLGRDTFLHRDYHAENLIWLPRESGLRRLGLLDFQDAFLGPAPYDVVSLLQDARRDVSPAVAASAIGRYLAGRPDLDAEAFRTACAVLGAHRAMRILGVMDRLQAQGRSFPEGMRERVGGHLDAALAHPALAKLKGWCERSQHGPFD